MQNLLPKKSSQPF